MNNSTVRPWGRDGDYYRRYADAATALLDEDPEFRRAISEWATFVVESHGDVFADLVGPNPRERVFVDACYFDFVVDRLLRVAQEAFEFELENPEPGDNSDALGVDFGALHEHVLAVEPHLEGVVEHVTGADLLDADVGFLRDLYEGVVSREVRLALGEYYTPRGVAELAVEALSVEDARAETFLDPGCGSGVFLAVCVDRKRDALAGEPPTAAVPAITETVYGIDLNPVAVRSAKLSYVLALAPLLRAADLDSVEVPVFLTDALGLTREDDLRLGDSAVDPRVDHLVGNPPWITWGNLPERARDAWRERYADRLDLLPHGGIESRLGHGNDDVSLSFVWVCLDRYLRAGGDASFVLKRAAMKGPAGALLRSGSVAGRPVAARFVHDFNALRPFGEGVDASAAVYTLATDADPEFPVPAASWTRDGTVPDFSSADSIRTTLARTDTGFEPVDPEDSTSSWIRRDAERTALGDCAHEIRHGLKDDAKAVFSIERARLDEIEPDRVFPYLASRHVVKYGLFGHDLHLVPMAKAGQDNEAELRETCPHTYEYLRDHENRLEERASSWLDDGPFYNVFGLGEYTWADYKVVWCRLGFKPHFAVVSTVEDPDLGEKPVVPGDHFMFVATDDEREAHFLTALLNSAPYQRTLRDLASEGKASLSKTVVSKLELSEYEGTAKQERLAALSMDAHAIVPEHTDVSKREYNRTTIEELDVVQADIDSLVEELLADGSV